MPSRPSHTPPEAIQYSDSARTGAFVVSFLIAECLLFLLFWLGILLVAALNLHHLLAMDMLQQWIIVNPLNLVLAIGATMVGIRTSRRAYPIAMDVFRVTPGCLQTVAIIGGGLVSIALAMLAVQVVFYFVVACC